MKRLYTPYAVARLDGALLYHDIRAGFTKNGSANLPIVHFKVRAGRQLHPVWALDDLAQEIFAYCYTAKHAGVSETHLQVNVVGSPVSVEHFSIIVANNIEWHIASSALRAEAEHLYATFKTGKMPSWPQTTILLPVSAEDLHSVRLVG